MRIFLLPILLSASLLSQGQTAITKLPAHDRAHLLNDDTFTIVKRIRDLPASVAGQLKVLTKDPSMADAGQNYQVTDHITDG